MLCVECIKYVVCKCFTCKLMRIGVNAYNHTRFTMLYMRLHAL